MSPPFLESSARTNASSRRPSLPSTDNDKSVPSVINPQPLSLNDLPAEIIDIIAQYVRSQRKRRYPVCRCANDKSHSFDLSTEPAEKYSDPSWALSCASKRYREIVFHVNKSRSYSLCYSRCCIRRVLAIPKIIRASVTYVQNNSANIPILTDGDWLSCSLVILSSDPNRHDIPRITTNRHDCCGGCDDCDDCVLCNESSTDDPPPQELRDVISLFPNASEVEIDWQVSDVGGCILSRTSSGNQLQHLRRLYLTLESDHYGSVYGSLPAEDAKMIIGSLPMPSLESSLSISRAAQTANSMTKNVKLSARPCAKLARRKSNMSPCEQTYPYGKNLSRRLG
jgi:hypothetical protein